MATYKVPAHGDFHVPEGIRTLKAFRRWIHADTAVPEKLAVHFLRGEVWVDFHMEEAYSHNFVKTAVYISLAPICEPLGLFFCDGMLLTNDAAGLGTEPDGMFVSNASWEAGRVNLASGRRGENTELIGTPDLVIEVVSPSSEDKDTEWLMSAYHNAGIPEYWLIDAREEDDLRLTIYKRGPKGYTAARKSEEWAKSPALGKSFRLTRREDRHGYPRFRLEVR
jgi:Uma2 family endonuclease